jgi:WD40 repeat protein
MDNKEIEKKLIQEYNHLEIARIIGEPVDPKKPYPEVVSLICETDTAEPDEYTYYFDVLAETDKIYVITSTGAVTQENVSPDTPALLGFSDVATPEYYVKLVDLASAKERVLARKLKTIDRALNAYEVYQVLNCINAGVPAANKFTLGSGYSAFTYKDLVDMIDSITDYSDGYVLIAGTSVDKDIKLWDWTDNKYTSLSSALKDLNVTIVRQFGQVNIDGAGTNADIISSNTAFLVGTNSVVGKPVLFVRKRLSDIDLLGGAIKSNGEKPERLVFVSPNPVHATSGTSRYLAVGITGYEQIAIALTNPYATARFIRV